MLTFEFDESKSQSNLSKHGINFVDAVHSMECPEAIRNPGKNRRCPRQSIIKVWLAERLEDSASNTPFQRMRREAALR